MESAALEPSSTGFEFDDSLLGAHYSDRIRSVVRFLFENPGEHTMPEVAEATSIPSSQCTPYLRRAVKYGLIANPRRGKYRIRSGVTATDKSLQKPWHVALAETMLTVQ